jgi:nitrogen fixation protein FixH
MKKSVTVNQNESTEHRRAWLWPGIVIGMLTVHTLSGLIVVFIATSDPSHAVVPNYHEKAVAWDEQRAQQRAGEALGWTTQIEVALAADTLGQRTVRASIRDADGKPLTGASVTVKAYHHARANTIIEAQLKEAAPGQYIATMDLRRPGLWAFGVETSRGDESYLYTVNQQVGPLDGISR